MRRCEYRRPQLARVLAVLALLTGSMAPALRAVDAKVTVFVGPQTRDGFVDVDSGILDSIKDIQDEFRRSRQFAVVRTGEEAQVVLVVLGRRTPGDSGTVGIPSGAVTLLLPIKRRAIDTVLRVGTYEKQITSESGDDDRWKVAAKRVVKDVTAWVSANRSSLTGRESPR